MANLEIVQYLVEFETYDDVLGATTVYFATGKGFASNSSDTPASTTYLPLVLDAGRIDEFLFNNLTTTGLPAVSTGQVILNNASRRLDYLMDRGLDGRQITIKERTTSQTASTATVRFRGVIESVSFSDRKVTLSVKSSFYRVKTDTYQPTLYAGTNDSSTIYTEGTEDGIGGTPKPKLLGNAATGNMPAILVDRAKEMYQLSSDPVAELLRVYVGRAEITEGTEHSTLAALVSATVTSGEYDFYLGDSEIAEGTATRGAYIRLGTTPSKQVTFDAIEGWKNLALYSEDFSNAAWTKTNVSITTPDSSVVNPDGTGTVCKFLSENTSTGEHSIAQDITLISGRRTQISIFCRAGDRDRLRIKGEDSGVGSGNYADFNLTAETVSENGDVEATIAALGFDGFYKLDCAFTAIASGTYGFTVAMLDGSGDVSYTGVSASGMYVFGASFEINGRAGPYKKTTSAAVYNNSWADLLWKIMDQRGYTLDTYSLLLVNAVDDAEAYHFQGNSEVNLEQVFIPILESGKGFLYTEDDKYKVGIFNAPTEAESVRTLDSRLLLGSPKIKIYPGNDETGGVPAYRVDLKYQKNYTVMNESEVFGTAELSDIPFVSEQFRSKSMDEPSVSTKHLNSTVKSPLTALANAADARLRMFKEMALYGQTRRVAEVKVPTSIAENLPLNSVFTLESNLYRVIGRRSRFLAPGSGDATASAVTLQGWGGALYPPEVTLVAPNFLTSYADFTRASSATLFTDATTLAEVGENIPRFDYSSTYLSRNLLIEGQRINSIRNNTMVGAGAPSTYPNNWANTFNGSGVSTSVSDPFVIDGIECVDVRISGTAAGSSVSVFRFENTTQIVASNGQAWTESAFLAIVGGSLSNISQINFNHSIRTAAGAFLEEYLGPDIKASLTSDLQRLSFSETIANASAARISPYFQVFWAGAGAVDITIRFGLPQMEQGSFASSPIKTLGSAAVTRSPDVATVDLTNVPWFNPAAFSIRGTFKLQGLISGAFQRLIQISDGTTNNRLALTANSAGQVQLLAVTGGSTQALINLGSSSTDVIKVAARFQANNFAGCISGATIQSDTNGTMASGLTTIGIGNNGYGSASPLYGHIGELTYLPPLSDSQIEGWVNS